MEMKDVVPSLAEVLLDPRFAETVILNFKRPVPYNVRSDDCPECVVYIDITGITSAHDDFVAKLKMGMLGIVSASVVVCTPKKARGAKRKITATADNYHFAFEFVGRHITMCVQPEKLGRPKILEKWRD